MSCQLKDTLFPTGARPPVPIGVASVSLLTVMLGVWVVFGNPQTMSGAILSHNGTRVSLPRPGTGEVDVTIEDLAPESEALTKLDFFKEFQEGATHSAQVAFFVFDIPAAESVVNISPTAWRGFRIDLEATNPVQFLGADLESAPAVDPVGPMAPIEFDAIGNVSVLNSLIEQPSATETSLLINFENPVDLGEGFDLRFGIFHGFGTNTNESSFTMIETPILIPEPCTEILALFGVLGSCLRTCRRGSSQRRSFACNCQTALYVSKGLLRHSFNNGSSSTA